MPEPATRRGPGAVRRGLAAVLALAALGLAACGGGDEPEPQAFHGAVLDEPYVVPETPLRTTEGEDFSLAASTDKPLTLVFFGYTHCPDICPATMADLAAALVKLDDQQRAQVEVVFVTTDPARDTPEVLRDYLDQFDPSFVGLTGDLDTIIEVGRPLAIAVEQGEKLPSGGYEVVHSTPVVAIDGEDRVPVLWTQDSASSAELASDIATLLADGPPDPGAGAGA